MNRKSYIVDGNIKKGVKSGGNMSLTVVEYVIREERILRIIFISL